MQDSTHSWTKLGEQVTCTAVTTSQRYNESLKRVNQKILAVETESGGVFSECKRKNIPAMAIRGISDLADKDKSDLEKTSQGNYRKIAAGNAATFLKLQLVNSHFLIALANRKASMSGQENLFNNIEPTKDIGKAITEIDDLGDIKLRALSPQYHLKDKGYRLPIPRIRQLQLTSGIAKVKGSPTEIRDALQIHQHIILMLPKTYPDHSIPWVLAHDLLTAQLNNKQVIPVVVDGTKISPPKGGIKSVAYYQFSEIANPELYQFVFIIEDFKLTSKTRINFLLSEIKNFPDAKFVFVDRKEGNILQLNEFATSVAADLFKLDEISFLEIAHFIEKNFSMDCNEPEVIALRLKNTFTQFKLTAHPTYFAGIPSETLSALLQANRRSELIQLATDGFLTFVVADDREDIQLSRTTRAKFLKRLVIELKVNKRRFTKAQLVEFTQTFATEFDFEIEALKFITAFVDKGIIRFDDDQLTFSLPFIEDYLLASALSSLPALACSYFQFDLDEVDLITFDLYSEICPSDELVDKLSTHLSTAIEEMEKEYSSGHVLLTDKIRPNLIANPEKIQSLTKMLEKAGKDILQNTTVSRKKQKILDRAERIREKLAQEAKPDKTDEVINPKRKSFEFALRVWAASVILLGSGAEHLTAERKKTFAIKIAELGSVLMHVWTQEHLKIDFKQVRVEVIAEESQKGDETQNKLAVREAEVQISDLVDLLEMQVLSDPFLPSTGKKTGFHVAGLRSNDYRTPSLDF